MRRFSLQEDRETLTHLKLQDSRKAYKNLIGICLSFTLIYGSFLGILSLQTSINAMDGLGLWHGAVLYIVNMLTNALGPVLINSIGSKYTLVLSAVTFLVYTMLNYYPHWGTLIPGAALLGTGGLTTVFVAMFSHATTTATRYAPALKEDPQHTVPFFMGIVGLSINLAIIFGNGISAATLWNLHDNVKLYSNNSASDDSVCDNDSASQVESNYIYYILITLYAVSCFVAIPIIVFTVDHYRVDAQFMSAKQIIQVHFLKPLKSMVWLSVANWKIICLAPLSFANGLTIGTVFGVYPQAYISNCYGVQWIGVMLVIYGVTGGISAISVGRLVKYVPQYIIMTTAFAVIGILSVFLIFWGISPDYHVTIIVIIGFSFSVSTINSLVPGNYGCMFKDKEDEKAVALSLFQVWFAMGFVVSFTTFFVLTPEQELWMTAGTAVLSIISYTVLISLTAIFKLSKKMIHDTLTMV